MLTAEPRIRLFIDSAAFVVGLPAWPVRGLIYLPGEWLEALILQESSGRPDVRRYEPHQDLRADGDTAGKDDGPAEDDASYGPMQVMGTNVRSIFGVSSSWVMLDYTALFDWPIGCGFGLNVLRAELRATGQDVSRALARYNGGPTGDRIEADGSMRLQRYVDSVEGYAAKVRADRLGVGWRYLGGLPGREW